ncbi:MAG: L-rhamnose isomerase [Firmicutes bacterium HGW-Firmicutes-9]|jgi:L-rhamnose isomerase|nr:MAG: L-rhamnose isomerase [Firmicutes bacterium HGW-Firmicutes-9]
MEDLPVGHTKIQQGFEFAKEAYAAYGVDVEDAISRADAIPVSMHCWQGDDVIGFDGSDSLSGGIQTTGNYPGRARRPEELRADIDKAISLIPGKTKLNLHACYAEKNGKEIDRDAYTIAEFSDWLDWAKSGKIGLDFNPTYFSHPMMDGDFSLSSYNESKRRFWIEHGKRCLEIAGAFAEGTGQPCTVNFWMPDGYKDTCADTVKHREIMTQSLDEIFATAYDRKNVLAAVESKLFGLGVESHTVASHEYALGYAISRNLRYTLDAGHFHPTEVISAKISAVLQFTDQILLHVSRGVRWDSDHVITLDDELQRIMDEIVWNSYENRVFIGLDYFDASINRIAAWAVGMRNARKAILNACLAPVERIRAAEYGEDFTSRLALLEDRKTLPFGLVWAYYCESRGIAQDGAWLDEVKVYERTVLSKR